MQHQFQSRLRKWLWCADELVATCASLFSGGSVMRTQVCSLAIIVAVATSAYAQAPAAPAQAPAASVVVDNPTYVTIPLEITVDRPAAEVWKRVGKYCDISEWLQIPSGCKTLSGTEGEVGSVRSVANEVMVGKTQYSYTYTQTPRNGRPYN